MSFLERIKNVALSKVTERLDSFYSTQTGLRTPRDKAATYKVSSLCELEDEPLASLYANNYLVKKLVDLPVSEAFRRGFDIMIDASDDMPSSDAIRMGADIRSAMDDLGIVEAMKEATRLQRIFRGAVVHLVVDDGKDQALPLDPKAIKQFIGARVIDRRFLDVVTTVSDEKDRNFGEPETVAIRPRTKSRTAQVPMATVHRSRLLFFRGMQNPSLDCKHPEWGMNAIDHVIEAIERRDITWAAISHMTQDGDQRVFAMEGLMEMLDGKAADSSGIEYVKKRYEMVNNQSSVMHAILIDKEGESFERTRHDLGKYAPLLQEMNQDVSAAGGIPMTKLFGASAAGLNATGENDRKDYQDEIAAFQVRDLEPNIQRVVEILTLMKDGPTGGFQPEDWSVKWAPLEQPSDLERAQIMEIMSKVDDTYANKLDVPSGLLVRSRLRPTGYSLETEISEEEMEEIVAADGAIETEEEGSQETEEDTPTPVPQEGGEGLPDLDSEQGGDGDEAPPEGTG